MPDSRRIRLEKFLLLVPYTNMSKYTKLLKSILETAFQATLGFNGNSSNNIQHYPMQLSAFHQSAFNSSFPGILKRLSYLVIMSDRIELADQALRNLLN